MTQGESTLKEELLQQFGRAHERLAAAASAAAARGITRRGDQWGPREILAHIVGWSAEATERLPRIIAGAPPLTYDDEAFNTAVLTVLGDQPFEAVITLFRQTHRRYVQMLSAQDGAVFVPDHPVYRRIQAVIEHHDAHAQGLEALV